MMVFSYNAVDAAGQSQTGVIEDTSRGAAVEALHRRGLVPIVVEEKPSRFVRPSLFEVLRAHFVHRNRVGPQDLVSMTQSLAALVRSGLTIDRALAVAATASAPTAARTALADLGRSVRIGRTFADALNDARLPLPPYYIGMIQAGEAGGSLPSTLSRLADLLRKEHEVRERIRSALIYPSMLGIVVVLTVVILLAFVLPRFEALFAESEVELPWSTRGVLAVGRFVSAYWWMLGATFCALIAVMSTFARTSRGQQLLDRWLIRSRWTLGLPAAIDTGRLFRTLSTLLSNGVQLAIAMRIAQATLSNSMLRNALDDIIQRIKAGESISATLGDSVFPTHAVQLARVGEETGQLEHLLLEAATILETESQTNLERLLALLVPLLTIVMGLLIAGLIGSVLIGLLSINDLAF